MTFIKIGDAYLVDSSRNTAKKYIVTIRGKSMTCNCPDYLFRQRANKGACKHIQEVREAKANEATYVEGQDVMEFLQNYSEEQLELLKSIGEVFEKNGKLYALN